MATRPVLRRTGDNGGMRVCNTEGFLRAKLDNLKQRLLADHGADEEQIDALEARLQSAGGGGLVPYAQALHGRSFDAVAAEVARRAGCTEDVDGAIRTIMPYLDCFASVTCAQDRPPNAR